MTTKMKVNKEYQVRRNRKDRQWEVIHVHKYPNYSYSHVVYSGDDWKLCMWIATGDLFYLPSPYGFELVRMCGSRMALYLEIRLR